ncbi:phage tail tape measure protein [Microbacterium sp. KNMS]
MADRSVKVSLILQAQGYMQGMDAASRKTRETGTELEKLAQKRDSFNQLGAAAVGFGAAVGVGVGMAVSSFMDFDQQMSAVQAATHETAANMDLLRDAAIDAGARTVYSASEAAGAIEELAKAGIATSDILGGGLDGALDLAAAGGIEVARAAEIAASAMTQFGLKGTDVTHVADLLAAGAGKAQGGVEEMSDALNQSGLVAAQMGLDLDDTVGSLTMFASAGLLGSDAGTSFRNMLLRLANPTGEAADLMKELGLDFYDAQGQFIGIEGVAGQLETRLKGLTEEQRNAALAQLFGQDAIRAASILYEGGAESVEKWTNAVNDAGYAQETAATRLDNLKGDWEELTGAIDSAFITMGSGANGPLRELVQGLTGMVNDFNALPDWMQQVGLMAGGAASGIGLLAGGALLAIPQIADFKVGLETLGLTGDKAKGRLAGLRSFLMGPWGMAMVGAVLGVEALKFAIDQVSASSEEMQNSLKTAGSASDIISTGGQGSQLKYWRDTAAQLQDLDGVLEQSIAQWQNLWLRLTPQGADTSAAERTLAGIGEELGALAQSDLPAAQRAFQLLADETDGSSRKLWALLSLMPDYKDQLVEAATAQGINVTALSEAERQQTLLALAQEQVTETGVGAEEQARAQADALAGLEGAAEDAEGKVQSLADAIRGFGSAEMDTRSAHREFEQAVDDLTASIEANGGILDRSTEAGRENEAAIDALAQRTLDLAAATLEQTGNEEDAARVIRDGRAALEEKLEAFGITGEAAQAYIDKLGLVPENVDTAVTLTGVTEAESALEWLARTRESRIVVWAEDGESGRMGNRIITPNATGNYFSGGKPKEFAAGGYASGIYPYTPGGIHKFAEAYDEAYISLDPAIRERSLDIWEQTGVELGAFRPAPEYVLAGGGGGRESVTYAPVINQRPGVSDRRIAQVAQEEFAFGLG